MAIVFTLGQEEAKFKVKVSDCVSGDAFDVSTITSQKIIFIKPNGTRLEKTATLTTDPLIPAESFVTYQNTVSEGSIFDVRWQWEYSAEITLSTGGKAQTSQSQVFWVV